MAGRYPIDDVGPEAATLAAVAQTAAELAGRGGERIHAELGREPAVSFKAPPPGRPPNSNPVSRLDREIEADLRTVLRKRFPAHAVLGEELPASQGASPYLWVIDPLDGTTNFINGLPLFACSVGVLHHGRPIAGAIWCSSSHRLVPGTYHSVAGSGLQFDGQSVPRRSAGPWRGLAAEPGRAPTLAASWDTRVFGCATIEFAFVAAGLLRIAYISRPRLWDVAAGLVLLSSAGCGARVRRDPGWDTMLYFPGELASLREWSEPLMIGSELDLAAALPLAE